MERLEHYSDRKELERLVQRLDAVNTAIDGFERIQALRKPASPHNFDKPPTIPTAAAQRFICDRIL